MKHTLPKVREFHAKFSHPIAKQPCIPELKVRMLRVNLIATELCELCDAWGLELAIVSKPNAGVNEEDRVLISESPGAVCSLDGAADALGDLDYVVQGANIVAGYPAEAVIDEIQASNMSKLGADGEPIKRSDGKVMKGPHYFKPDIAKVLAPYLSGKALP